MILDATKIEDFPEKPKNETILRKKTNEDVPWWTK